MKNKLSDSNLILGYGISAYTLEDAILIFEDKVLQGEEMPKIKEVISNVDVNTLDKGHVIPHMGVVSIRGVWFPRRYGS